MEQSNTARQRDVADATDAPLIHRCLPCRRVRKAIVRVVSFDPATTSNSRCTFLSPPFLPSGALRDALGTRYTFDFIQAPLPTDPYPGIELFHEGPYFSWYDESITSKELAIASVLAYIKAHSVTAVMGFSQGCALAAALVAFHPLAVEWALFIGGGWPLGEWQLKTKPAIMIPAVHVVGLYDVVRSRSLELLSHHAPGSTGLLYEHPGAHVVPRKPDEVSEIVKLVHTVANRACANRSYEEAARTDGNAKS